MCPTLNFIVVLPFDERSVIIVLLWYSIICSKALRMQLCSCGRRHGPVGHDQWRADYLAWYQAIREAQQEEEEERMRRERGGGGGEERRGRREETDNHKRVLPERMNDTHLRRQPYGYDFLGYR